MKTRRNIFRDVVVFSLPLTTLLTYFALALLMSFYTGEIENFHGYPVRGLRLGGLKAVIREALSPIFNNTSRRYIARVARRDDSPRPIRHFDLHVEGRTLDRLARSVPASGMEWRPAHLVEGQEWIPVDVHYRGQQMSNYFWPRKAWKIKTPRSRLVDGFRVINLTPAENRLESHLTFLIAEEAGLSSPQSRIVQLFLNLKDQGLYLQEEQIDESMIRRIGRMPGDIYYGELFFPEEPKRSSDDLFWNPYVWRKKSRNNIYSEEYRPYLTELLDHITSDSSESFAALYRLLDIDQFARYLAVITFQGDLHVDHSHNHRLYFNPLTGEFEALLWNSRMTLLDPEGVESMANRFFRKLTRDPRFLDRVHEVLHRDLYLAGATAVQLQELDRIQTEYSRYALDRQAFARQIDSLRGQVRQRGAAVERFLRHGDVRFTTEAGPSGTVLRILARAGSSLRLESVTLQQPTGGFRLFEDRDFDGTLSDGDREIQVSTEGPRLRIAGDPIELPVGRDYRAPYSTREGEDAFLATRDFTRLAYLETPFLLISPNQQERLSVVDLEVGRTIGNDAVAVAAGPAEDYIASETVHPWRFAEAPPPRRLRFSGTVEITQDLVLEAQDLLEVEPGTELLLGPGVSLVLKSRVHLDGFKVRRLDPEQPWGVLALLGAGASGSILEDCELTGGSHDTLQHVYYSGMLSVHYADRVSLRSCSISNNVLGDDSIRFAAADELSISNVTVSRANGDAIDCDISRGRISDTVIETTRNDGLDLMTSEVDLERLVIRGAGDKGISFGERAVSVGSDVRIESSTTGIAIKDGSDPLLTNLTIRDCVVGVDGFDKNWRYPGGGKGKLVACQLQANDLDVRLDAVSELTLDGCSTRRRFEIAGGLESGRLQLRNSSDLGASFD